jgi:hypothetical protein
MCIGTRQSTEIATATRPLAGDEEAHRLVSGHDGRLPRYGDDSHNQRDEFDLHIL